MNAATYENTMSSWDFKTSKK